MTMASDFEQQVDKAIGSEVAYQLRRAYKNVLEAAGKVVLSGATEVHLAALRAAVLPLASFLTAENAVSEYIICQLREEGFFASLDRLKRKHEAEMALADASQDRHPLLVGLIKELARELEFSRAKCANAQGVIVDIRMTLRDLKLLSPVEEESDERLHLVIERALRGNQDG